MCRATARRCIRRTRACSEKDQSIAFQMHYTTSGKPTHDATRFGLYFHKEPPKYLFKTAVLANPKISIPANTKAHTGVDRQQFPQRHPALSADAARALPRHRVELRREVSGRHARSCCCRCRSTTSTGRRRTCSPSRSDPGRHEDRAQHDLRQLEAEPGEPGPESGRAVGRAVVRRDAVRRRAVSRADADAAKVSKTAVTSN